MTDYYWQYWTKIFNYTYRSTCPDCGQEYHEGKNPYENHINKPITFPFDLEKETKKLNNLIANGRFDNHSYDTSNDSNNLNETSTDKTSDIFYYWGWV